MSEVEIAVHPVDAPETARALLAAAEEAGLHPRVVKTVAEGFLVPEEVAQAAGLGAVTEQVNDTPEKPTAKRGNAKAAAAAENAG